MRVLVPTDIPPAEQLGRVHFVGVGGAALSGLARIMAARGVLVTGSDAREAPALAGLRTIGITCWVGHDAAHVSSAEPDVVVVSTAVRADNPEVVRAAECGITIWPRSAAVQSVLVGRTAVVVTGTHGKTTTAAMLTTALWGCGADPSYAIGSVLAGSGLNAADGSGELFVVEGDESDGAILTYSPFGALVTNVDADHLDVYDSPADYARVFEEFIDRIDRDGFLVVCGDDPGAGWLADVARTRGLRVVTAGQQDGVDMQAVDVSMSGETSRFDVRRADGHLATVTLQVPGATYVTDAVCALAVGVELGFDADQLAAGLGEYRGSGRRMQHRGTAAQVRVYDSYAHHPTEIAADLGAARQVAGDGRLVVCFQPHLYSRTRYFGAEMGKALGAADAVVVMEIYPAREEPEPGVTAELVARAVPLSPDRVVFEPAWSQAATRLAEIARPGDLVLTLGAGDVTDIGPELLSLLDAEVGR